MRNGYKPLASEDSDEQKELKYNAFGEDNKGVDYPPAIPRKRTTKIVPSNLPADRDEKTFNTIRRAKIHKYVVEALQTVKADLQGSRTKERLAEALDWNEIAKGLSTRLSSEGYFWHLPDRQKSLKKFGWGVLKIAQVTELLYTIGGVFLSFLKEPITNIMFWVGLVPTIYSFLGTLLMNVALVNPDEEVAEVVCPDHLLIDYDQYKLNMTIEFINDLIKKSNLGIKNDFDAEFQLRYLMPLSELESNRELPLLLSPINWVSKLINNLSFYFNNIISPAGNWIAIPYVIGAIAAARNTTLSLPMMLAIGAPTFLAVLITDGGYYIALGQGPKDQANKDTWSSRNPIVRAFKIDWVSAMRGLVEYIKNALLRGVTVAGCISAAMTYLNLEKSIDSESFKEAKRFGVLIVFIMIAINTAFTRHRAFNGIIAPYNFTALTSETFIITNPKILDFCGARTIASRRFESNHDLQVSLRMKSLAYGLCDAMAAGILTFKNMESIYALIITMSVAVTSGLFYFYSTKRTQINQWARDILDEMRGVYEDRPQLSPQILSLVFWTVLQDAISRAVSRTGAGRGFMDDTEIGTWGMTDMELFAFTLFFTVSAALPEKAFFQTLMEKNAPELVKFVDENSKDEKESEAKGCWTRVNRLTAKAMKTLMPNWFAKGSVNTILSVIFPYYFGPTPKTVEVQDHKTINSLASDSVRVMIYSESTKSAMEKAADRVIPAYN